MSACHSSSQCALLFTLEVLVDCKKHWELQPAWDAKSDSHPGILNRCFLHQIYFFMFGDPDPFLIGSGYCHFIDPYHPPASNHPFFEDGNLFLAIGYPCLGYGEKPLCY